MDSPSIDMSAIARLFPTKESLRADPRVAAAIREAKRVRKAEAESLAAPLQRAVDGFWESQREYEEGLREVDAQIASVRGSLRDPAEFQDQVLERFDRLVRAKERRKPPTKGMEEQITAMLGPDLWSHFKADRASRSQLIALFEALASKGRNGAVAKAPFLAFALDLYARDRLDGDRERMPTGKELHGFLKRQIKARPGLMPTRTRLWSEPTWNSYVSRARKALK